MTIKSTDSQVIWSFHKTKESGIRKSQLARTENGRNDRDDTEKSMCRC